MKMSAESQMPAMGITGWFAKNFSNLSAVTVCCGMMVWLVFELNLSSKEDRAMFREELKAIRVEANDRYMRTESTYKGSMEKMGSTVERAVTSMEKATRALEKVAERQENP